MLLLVAMLTPPASAQDGPDVKKGQQTYTARCRACHGVSGNGAGPAARALPKKPPDFTVAEFWEGLTDDALEATIRMGKPGSAMRSFPMKEVQMNNLVAYLRTFEPASE